MAQFTKIKALIQETGILSFDLETTSKTEDPDDAKVPMRAKLELVAISSGKGAERVSMAVDAGEDIYEFLRTYLTDPNITVVGHNHIGFDYEVLHYNGVMDYTDIKAKPVDTLLWSWLYDENMDHRLKPCVEKFFKYKMVTYEEAYLFSPSQKRIAELQKEIKKIEKNDIGRADIRARKQRTIDRKSLEADFKKKFAGKRTKADNEEKKIERLNILAHLDKLHGEAAVENKRLKIREEKIIPLESAIRTFSIAWEKDKKAYAADDAAQTSRLYYRLGREFIHRPNLANWSSVMHEVRAAAARIEMNGIMIDTEYLEKLDKEFNKLVGEFEARIHNIARVPDLNPRSPKQLEHVMYDILAIEPLEVMEKGKWATKRSTAEHVLSRMSHPIAQAILDYRAIQKLQSTYIQSIYTKVQFDGQGRLFGHLNTTGAVTGRWSSSGPNLQNIPSRSKPAQYDERIQNLGPKIRKAFIAPPGRKLVCADLSQIELRLIAHFTEDVNLFDVYTQCQEYDGITYYTGDIHHTTATKLNLPRKIAKNCNFGLCLVVGTQILTQKGYRDIEDIQVGDIVMTRIGWSTVTELQQEYAQDLVEVETHTGRILRGTPDHMLQRYFPSANGQEGGHGWVEMRDLSVGNYLVYGGEGYSEGQPASVDSCRLLGWYISEGNYGNHRYKISQSPHSNKAVCKKMDETLGFKWYDLAGSPHISAPKNIFERHLKTFGLEEAVAKRIPKKVYGLNESSRLEILGALWDGDGSVCSLRKRMQLNYWSKSRPLLNDVIRLLDSVGINARLYDYGTGVAQIGIIGSKSRRKFLERVPSTKCNGLEYEPIKTNRAEEKIIRHEKIHLQTPVTVYDFTVKDDPSFIANGLVSHNCYGMWAAKFARYAKLYIPQEDGTKILDVDAAAKHRNGFFKLYPGIMEEIERLEETRDTRNPFGNIQTTYETLSGRYRRFPQGDFATGGKILNSIIQGSAADILNLIIIMLYRYIIDNPMFTNPKLIMQVHDEVCIECEEYEAHDIAVLTKYIMEQPWLKIAVPILAGVKICDTWADNNDDDIPEVGLMPPSDSGIRPAVAMLSEEDIAWASNHVTYENFNPKSVEGEELDFEDLDFGEET